jgi:hypothetical protein
LDFLTYDRLSRMEGSKPRSTILWQYIWGLSALLTAICLSWMAYGFYQPRILSDLGFIRLSTQLGIIQGILGAVLEPVVGGLSDRTLRRFGSRLPQITIGVTLAGLLFKSVALLLQAQLQGLIRWLIPIMMTLWVMAMIIFRGPVVALLQQAAPFAALPRANVVLAAVFGAVGSLEPLLNQFLQQVGASITFLLGAIALVFGAATLYFNLPTQPLFVECQVQRSRVASQSLGLIFLAGLGIGLEQNLLLRAFPPQLQQHYPGLDPAFITSAILLIAALSTFSLERLTTKLSIRLVLLMGVALPPLCLGLGFVSTDLLTAVFVILLSGIAFGLILISQIPFTLGIFPPDRAGLSTGLFFGGIGAATALLSALLQQPLTELAALGWAIAALLLSTVTINGLSIH